MGLNLDPDTRVSARLTDRLATNTAENAVMLYRQRAGKGFDIIKGIRRGQQFDLPHHAIF